MAKKPGKKWSSEVTKHSRALALDQGVFTWKNPRRIAASLKRSAEVSKNRKASAFRSALSMLSFYINRAGKDLPAERRKATHKYWWWEADKRPDPNTPLWQCMDFAKSVAMEGQNIVL